MPPSGAGPVQLADLLRRQMRTLRRALAERERITFG